MKNKSKKGFTIIESLIYIFMTTLILNEGIYLTVLMYKSYLCNAQITKEYNDIQNFYVGLQQIVSERNISEVDCDETENKLIFHKYVENTEKKKSIEFKSNGSAIVKSYDSKNKLLNEDKMLGNVADINFKKKDNLIYMVLYYNDGKEFISCL